MRNLFLAIVLVAFGINEANAQRRGNCESNGTRVVRTTNGRVNVFYNNLRPGFNRGLILNNGFYNPRFDRRFNTYYYGPTRFGNVVYGARFTPEQRKQRLEEIRAHFLFKYVNKPSKRNRKRLVKYNILTGRDTYEDVN